MKKEKTKNKRKKKKYLFQDLKSVYRNQLDKDELLKKTVLPICTARSSSSFQH